MKLKEIHVRPVTIEEETRFKELMQAHHYLGAIPKVGETLWYVALWQTHWIGLLSFSSAAWKCAARDRWIGWSYRHQYDRLHLIANNSRFLILPDWHYPNVASRVLSLTQKRLQSDWQERFHHPLLLLETFVDPQLFQGTVYKAANWVALGSTQGFTRTTAKDYSLTRSTPKWILAYPLQRNARRLLSDPQLDSSYHFGATKLMITADQMRSLPDFFRAIPDPRRTQGRRHHLATVLSIAAGAVLCGRVGFKAMAEWANGLGQKARERFGCRYQKGVFMVPSEYVIRDLLIRVAPEALDQALQQWNAVYGEEDESLAIDGKTMRNAIDSEGKQTHIMSAIGHQTLCCYTQKKSAPYR